MAAASQTIHDAVRTGSWWTQVAPVVLGLGAFPVYATWRAFEGAYFWAAPYLSPFYSPLLDVHHRYWPYSPALLILGGPLGFRATCYYYRKAYYRAFFLDPPACAVGERKRNYRGETRFPFILQNVHRYFMYLAVVFLAFLWHDAIVSFRFPDGFAIGVGTVVLLVNVVLLTLYFGSFAPSAGREARLLLLRAIRPGTSFHLAKFELFERTSHVTCLGQPLFGWIG